jgi:hypothetical protein
VREAGGKRRHRIWSPGDGSSRQRADCCWKGRTAWLSELPFSRVPRSGRRLRERAGLRVAARVCGESQPRRTRSRAPRLCWPDQVKGYFCLSAEAELWPWAVCCWDWAVPLIQLFRGVIFFILVLMKNIFYKWTLRTNIFHIWTRVHGVIHPGAPSE